MANSNTEWDLEKQINSAKTLIADLQAYEDDDLCADMIEGETTLHEAALAVYDAILGDEALLEAQAARIKTLQARKARIQDRISTRKAIVERAFVETGAPKIEGPEITLSIRKTPANLIITEEDKIPTEFWKIQDPRLDLPALKKAAKEGEVPGCTMDNGGVALQARKA
jgi:hypothetical protein